jgi:hypothetical protein
MFPIGTTTVTCTATDTAGNTGSDSFVVTVRDTTAPALEVSADKTGSADGSTGSVVTYTAPTATDAVDGAVAATCLPASGSQFPADTVTTVTCTASDAHANRRTATFTVTVGSWVEPVAAALIVTPPQADPPAATPPVAPTCTSRRVLTVHVPKRHLGRMVRAVTATIDGHKARVNGSTGRWTVRVDMKGRERMTVAVRLRVRLDGGRRATIARAFRTCRTPA